MNRILTWIASFTLGKYLVAPLAWAHDKMDGHRTEIATGIVALVHVLKLTGTIPPDTADAIERVLLPIIPVVLADKVSKVLSTADKIVPKLPQPPQQ